MLFHPPLLGRRCYVWYSMLPRKLPHGVARSCRWMCGPLGSEGDGPWVGADGLGNAKFSLHRYLLPLPHRFRFHFPLPPANASAHALLQALQRSRRVLAN